MQKAVLILLDFGDADRRIRQPEYGVADRHQIHRVEQAIFPRQAKLIGVADIDRALHHELAGEQRHVGIADFVRRHRRGNAHAIELDRVLVAQFHCRQIIGVDPLGDFKTPDIVGLVRVGACDLQRVFIAVHLEVVVGEIVNRRDVGREARGARILIADGDAGILIGGGKHIGPVRRDCVGAGRRWRAGADAGECRAADRILHAEIGDEARRQGHIDLRRRGAEGAGGGQHDRDAGALHRPGNGRGVAIGNESQQSARPDRRGIGELEPAPKNARCLLLVVERRRQRQADCGAIGLVRGVAARAVERGRVDAADGKADAVLGVGEEIADELGGVGVDAVGAGAVEEPPDLEIVVVERRRIAQVVIRRADVSGALIGERLRGVGGRKIAPHRLRRRAGEQRQPQARKRINRLPAPYLIDGGDRSLAQRHDDRGGVVVAGDRPCGPEYSAFAAATAALLRYGLEIIVPDDVRRELGLAPDDRNRQRVDCRLDLQAGIIRWNRGLLGAGAE